MLIFRYASAYAAQAIVLDCCCEQLLDAIHAGNGDQWVVTLIGARGFPLGEHTRIGGVDPRMYAEQLHVPWLIRFPDEFGRLARSQALTSHHDLLPTLIEWIDRDRKIDQAAFDGRSVLPLATAAQTAWRDVLFSTSPTARAIRTSEWCLREDLAAGDNAAPSDEETSRSELYVRPDDRWEANDVAKLCSDVVESLHEQVVKHTQVPGC